MLDIRVASEELRPIVREIVSEVLSALTPLRDLDRLAIPEKEAARLLSLNPWQLRDLRLSGKIQYSRIVGRQVRYTHDDLVAYLAQGR